MGSVSSNEQEAWSCDTATTIDSFASSAELSHIAWLSNGWPAVYYKATPHYSTTATETELIVQTGTAPPSVVPIVVSSPRLITVDINSHTLTVRQEGSLLMFDINNGIFTPLQTTPVSTTEASLSPTMGTTLTADSGVGLALYLVSAGIIGFVGICSLAIPFVICHSLFYVRYDRRRTNGRRIYETKEQTVAVADMAACMITRDTVAAKETVSPADEDNAGLNVPA